MRILEHFRCIRIQLSLLEQSYSHLKKKSYKKSTKNHSDEPCTTAQNKLHFTKKFPMAKML